MTFFTDKMRRALASLRGFPVEDVVLEIFVLMAFYIFKLNKENLKMSFDSSSHIHLPTVLTVIDGDQQTQFLAFLFMR